MLVAFALVATSCNKERVDPETARCSAARAAVTALIASSKRCETDADCEIFAPSCGLPFDCGGVAVTKTSASTLRNRSDAFARDGCVSKIAKPWECPDLRDRAHYARCAPLGPPACRAGSCEAHAPPYPRDGG